MQSFLYCIIFILFTCSIYTILHLRRKRFTATTCLCGIGVLERKASTDKSVTVVQLHAIQEEEALRITNCNTKGNTGYLSLPSIMQSYWERSKQSKCHIAWQYGISAFYHLVMYINGMVKKRTLTMVSSDYLEMQNQHHRTLRSHKTKNIRHTLLTKIFLYTTI